MKIKILGTGCSKCRQLEAVTREVIQEMRLKAEIEKVKDVVKIMEYPILSTPALVIDEKVVLAGKVPTKEEIITFVNAALGK